MNSLLRSFLNAGIQHQIVLLDDFSEPEYRRLNSELADLNNIIYIELPKNTGRAKTRNLLASYAVYPWLLFLDCDSMPVDENNFIAKYVKVIQSSSDIICGGRIYSKAKPSHDYNVHYQYGSRIESKPASERSKSPVIQFHSNNFLIHKEVFKKLLFNEEIKGYGYEDIAFAYRAQKEGYQILHSDNPVYHTQLDTNRHFIEKTKNALINLNYLYHKKLIPETKLIGVYKTLKFIFKVIPFKSNLIRFLEIKLLEGSYQTLYFQIWKLLIFNQLNSTKN